MAAVTKARVTPPKRAAVNLRSAGDVEHRRRTLEGDREATADATAAAPRTSDPTPVWRHVENRVAEDRGRGARKPRESVAAPALREEAERPEHDRRRRRPAAGTRGGARERTPCRGPTDRRREIPALRRSTLRMRAAYRSPQALRHALRRRSRGQNGLVSARARETARRRRILPRARSPRRPARVARSGRRTSAIARYAAGTVAKRSSVPGRSGEGRA